MPKKWLYFPFSDISKDTTMPQNRKRYEDKYGQDLTVRFKGSQLNDVGDDDMLIIAGHGLPNSSLIGIGTEETVSILGITFSRPTQVTMTANDLAQELVDANLPRTHRYIKLITCGGAGMVAVDDAKATIANNVVASVPVVNHSHQSDCLASVLAKELGRMLYGNVMVKGYPGFVNAIGAQKVLTVEATSEFSMTKKWYQHVTGGVERGYEYWKDGSVGMARNIPTKLMNDYWFNSSGALSRQHIKLK